MGFTCLGFSLAEDAKKCRFCSVPLSEDNLAKDAPAPVLEDCCTEPDCLQRRDTSCTVVLPCGHPCGGLCDDGAAHPPCLVCGKRAPAPGASCPSCKGPLMRYDSRDSGWRCDGIKHPDKCASGITDFHQTKGCVASCLETCSCLTKDVKRESIVQDG
eukprot:SAG31_NODE_929_length_10926_cov_8.162834_12_plen_158_part_00